MITAACELGSPSTAPRTRAAEPRGAARHIPPRGLLLKMITNSKVGSIACRSRKVGAENRNVAYRPRHQTFA